MCRKPLTRSALLLTVTQLALIQPGAASAEQSTPTQDDRTALSYTLSIYAWASGLNGSERIGRLPEVDVDVGFSDILDVLEFAAAGALHVRRDRFGFLGEVNYVNLEADAADASTGVKGSVDVKSSFALAAITYRAAEEDWGNVDLIGGVKYFKLDNTAKLAPPPVKASNSQSWFDATIGAKANFVITPDWSFTTWAMVGTGGSDLSWDVLGTFDYAINQRWSVSAGYRATGVDYSSSKLDYDMIQSGPIFAVTAHF